LLTQIGGLEVISLSIGKLASATKRFRNDWLGVTGQRLAACMWLRSVTMVESIGPNKMSCAIARSHVE
jgi:hypothetical protein